MPPLAGELERLSWKVDVWRSESPAHLVELARRASQEGSERIVSCGGDGTLHHVLQGLDLESVTLAVAPLGSGNDFASVVGMPARPAELARAIAEGPVREVDVGIANERRFLGVAGLGFDAVVARHAQDVPFLRGSAIYLWALFRVLPSFRPVEMTWELDGESRKGPLMLAAIGNTHRYGGGVQITPGASPMDGWLDACLVHGCTTGELLRMLPRAYRGRHVGSRFVEMQRARRLRFDAEKILEVFADGELVATTPVDFSIAPRKLRIVHGG